MFEEIVRNSPTETIRKAFLEAYWDLRKYSKIMVSVSGGRDSDILIDFILKMGLPLDMFIFVFFNTGMEFEATKKHLDFLEEKYGIKIHREKAVIPVPLGVKKYGSPFISKQVSEFIMRLQKHNFTWVDGTLEELSEEFPDCNSALEWWCNRKGEKSKLNISNWKWLKEFLIENPPDFEISPRCCDGAKKKTAHALSKKFSPDLDIQGVRKFENGARSIAYKTCFDEVESGADRFRPIFWFTDEDKQEYEKAFNVTNSDCYTVYGLPRTGCACCPFGSNFENELIAAEKYEPQLFKAANNVFGKSYEYTRKYREFKAKMNDKGGENE